MTLRSSLLLLLCMGISHVHGQALVLDPTFGEGGKVVLTLVDGTSIVGEAEGIKMLGYPDGSVVIVVQGASTVQLARLHPDGAQDLSFGVDGVLGLPAGERLLDAFVLDDGSIQIGTRFNGWGLARQFLPDGAVDISFGVAGMAALDSTTFHTQVLSYTRAFDGRFHFGGIGTNEGAERPFLVRFGAQGTLDPSFANAGLRWLSEGNGESCDRIHSTPTGDLVLGIRSYNAGSYYWCVTNEQGVMTIPGLFFNGLGNHYFFDTALDPAGRLLAAQHSSFSVGNGSGYMEWVKAFDLSISQSTFQYQPVPYTLFEDVFYSGQSGGQTRYKRSTTIASDMILNHYAAFEMLADSVGWKIERYPDPVIPTHLPAHVYTVFADGERASPSDLLVSVDGKLTVIGRSRVNGVLRIVLARYNNIPDPRVVLELQMALGGVMDTTSGLMRDDLRMAGLLPTLEPYSGAGRSEVNGVGRPVTSAAVLAVANESAIVDWVWLELLSPEDTATVVATRVGLLHRDGSVTQADGHSPIDFAVGTGSYFLRVAHRNHLAVTMATPILLSATPTFVDLTSPSTATFGTEAQWTWNGVNMLWPGDATANGRVTYVGAANDRDAVLVEVGGSSPTATTTGYLPTDVNLDGQVKYTGAANDRDMILRTLGAVPTAVRVEQGP